ncbi:MAG TPA: hypothetical protein VI279_00645 [Rhodocyclaceae bacterium]
MNTPANTPAPDPRRRLKDLLSIPEYDRTDEQWDEINELEIQLAPGNRASAPANYGQKPMHHGQRNGGGGHGGGGHGGGGNQGGGGGAPGGGGGAPGGGGKRPNKKRNFGKKPPFKKPDQAA